MTVPELNSDTAFIKITAGTELNFVTAKNWDLIMLDFLRRFYAHTAGKIITILVGLLFIVGFSFLPYIMGAGGGASPSDVAVVAGKGISLNDLNRYYGKLENEYEKLYGNKLTRKELSMLNLTGSALSSLIADKVLELKAPVFGIEVSNGFIARNIASAPAFQKNGKFSGKLFKADMLDNHMTPAAFEKNFKNEITREYIKRVVEESFSVVDTQFINDYKIRNKSVSFKIAVFKTKNKADKFLKSEILFNKDFSGIAKKYGGGTVAVPLFTEAGIIKSFYFKKYRFNADMLKSIFSSGRKNVINEVFPVKSGYAVIKILKVYFPRYVSGGLSKANNKESEMYAFQKEQEFLDYYVDYLESKSNVKINKNALSSFHPY